MIVIKKIIASKTYPLRIEILRRGIDENYKFKGDANKTTFHLAALDNNKVIGIASFIKNKNPHFKNIHSYQLRGMAISNAYQHKGIGKLLVHDSYKILDLKGCKILWCNAREISVGFYLKLGFTIIGEVFNIPKIGLHHIMFKHIL